MENAATLSLVRYHAGLEDRVQAAVPALADVLSNKTEYPSSFEDVMKVLQRLNSEVNGPTPSEIGSKDSHFPRALIYAVHELIRMLREAAAQATSDDELMRLERGAWRLEVAWSAILSGDIDDLDEHIAEEEAGRP
jgi:hypothetical protein